MNSVFAVTLMYIIQVHFFSTSSLESTWVELNGLELILKAHPV